MYAVFYWVFGVLISTGVIGLVQVSDVENSVLKLLKDSLEGRFTEEVVLDSVISLPDFAYNKKRKQYYSTAVLRIISDSIKNMNYRKILGVVDKDLYVRGLNFVFGEAERIGGRVGIISLTRLKQEFYNLPPDNELFIARAIKEAVHELGHLYGLYHCEDPTCVMYFSNSLSDTDRKTSNFCTKCRAKLNKY